MFTIESLKIRLRDEADAVSGTQQPLSNDQYRAGFELLTSDLGKLAYSQFIIPQLSRLLNNFDSHSRISVLEIGPGPKSMLAQLPYRIRQSIAQYTAFEPNNLFATRLKSCLSECSEVDPPLPGLQEQADIRPIAFTPRAASGGHTKTGVESEAFDIILFCHSMYGMKPKREYLQRALGMLAASGIIVVFHRGESLFIEDMACCQTAYFPAGEVSVDNRNHIIDCFTSFIAGFYPREDDANHSLLVRWRKVCREMGIASGETQNHLCFGSPEVMVVFNKNANSLSSLVAELPTAEHKSIKNRDARLQRSAAHIMPRHIKDVQSCVLWAIENELPLTVLSGSHSDHCVRSNVVTIDMANFADVNLVPLGGNPNKEPDYLIVAGSGCKAGDIVKKAMEKGRVVPLGARPSVGSGLWLQGGIGHLTRQHGLTCDAIVGAVLVTVNTGQVVYAGTVPYQYQPRDAVCATNEAELLWGLKGAGTNFGIVIHVVFRTFPTITTRVQNWSCTVETPSEAQHELRLFEESIAKKLTKHCSADVYLHCIDGRLRISGTCFDRQDYREKTAISWPLNKNLEAGSSWENKDAIELFTADLYMTGINGGHESGKTFSFKRCVFLQNIGDESRASLLVRALESRPSNLCYLHLVHGGGAANATPSIDTSFGCRDWAYACVITAVWPRQKDDSCSALKAKQWVYDVVDSLLPLSSGIYGADLGPDPRDLVLSRRAFSSNLARLSQLKRVLDPCSVLAYACPLPRVIEQKLVVIVTGQSCAGKDYCAAIWASILDTHQFTARVASISDVTKAEYAMATGTNLYRLLHDRAYKELHRRDLTAFFQSQVQKRPKLPEEHFQSIVDEAVDVDVLLITGMRDEAPVAQFSHLVSQRKLIEVNVTASKDIRGSRKWCGNVEHDKSSVNPDETSHSGQLGQARFDHQPDFVFDNTTPGNQKVEAFAEKHLVPLLSMELKQVADMIRIVPDFPCPGIEFRHILNIAQHPGGLALGTSLLKRCFGDWNNIGAIACCEASGYIFASALALHTGIPLVIIRKSGKLPPPTKSVSKPPSHISSPWSSSEEQIEMSTGAVSPSSFVVVVDDVLASGRTLLAVLQLLDKMEIDSENIAVLVVAEFPAHRGRDLLRRNGFGSVRVQSLLVFGGV